LLSVPLRTFAEEGLTDFMVESIFACCTAVHYYVLWDSLRSELYGLWWLITSQPTNLYTLFCIIATLYQH